MMEKFNYSNLEPFHYMAKSNHASEVDTSYFCLLSTPHIKRTCLFSHYFPSGHVLQLILSLLSLEWTLDLGLAKEISGSVSTTN